MMLALSVVEEPVIVARLAGAVRVMTGGWFGFTTAVTLTAVEVVVLPPLSVALAVRE